MISSVAASAATPSPASQVPSWRRKVFASSPRQTARMAWVLACPSSSPSFMAWRVLRCPTSQPAREGLVGVLAGCDGPSPGRIRLTPKPDGLALQPLCSRQQIAIAGPLLLRPLILWHASIDLHRLPRRCRGRGLPSRRSGRGGEPVADQFLVGQAAPDDGAKRGHEAAPVRTLAGVEPIRLLIEVAEQVERLDATRRCP